MGLLDLLGTWHITDCVFYLCHLCLCFLNSNLNSKFHWVWVCICFDIYIYRWIHLEILERTVTNQVYNDDNSVWMMMVMMMMMMMMMMIMMMMWMMTLWGYKAICGPCAHKMCVCVQFLLLCTATMQQQPTNQLGEVCVSACV